MHHFFFGNAMKAEEENEQAKQRVETSASRVVIGLQGHEPANERVKDIQKPMYAFTQYACRLVGPKGSRIAIHLPAPAAWAAIESGSL